MMCQSLRCLIIALLAIAASVAGADVAFAQSERETAREAGPVIRHKVLYRSTRLEFAPLVGITVNDAYVRNLVTGAALSYHLTNEWGLSVMGGYGVTQFDTELRTNTEAVLEQNSPTSLQELSYSYIKWLVGAEISYVPIVGKFSLFDSLIANYDIHLLAGFSFVGEGAVPAVPGNEVDPQLEGLRPAPVIGLGARLFLSDGISANLEVRDFMYNRSEVSTRSANPEFRNNVMVSVGLSLFLPQAVSISR
jgi:outer membrane beta-barrel protein